MTNFEKNNFIKYGYPEDRLYVIPAGVNFPSEHESKSETRISSLINNRKYFLYIGRLAGNKGIFDLRKS